MSIHWLLSIPIIAAQTWASVLNQVGKYFFAETEIWLIKGLLRNGRFLVNLKNLHEWWTRLYVLGVFGRIGHTQLDAWHENVW